MIYDFGSVTASLTKGRDLLSAFAYGLIQYSVRSILCIWIRSVTVFGTFCMICLSTYDLPLTICMLCMICISTYDLSLAFCMFCTICNSTSDLPLAFCTFCMVSIGTYDLRLTLCSVYESVRYTSVRPTLTMDLSDTHLYA